MAKAEKVIYYLVCIIGTLLNLVNWSGTTGFSTGQALLMVESVILIVLWIGPLVKRPFFDRITKLLLYIEVIFLIVRLWGVSTFL